MYILYNQKAIVAKETNYFEAILSNSISRHRSLVGTEWPLDDVNHDLEKKIKINGKSFYPNCYPVEWIENHWSPKLNEALKKRRAA